MPRSRAFEAFIQHSKTTGKLKSDGYDPNLLDEIYPEERSEVEDTIVHLFLQGDSFVAIFLPQLQKYDGMELLKKKLNDSNMPSGVSIRYASILFQHTGDEQYFDILKKCVACKKYRTEALVALMHCVPSVQICRIFQDVCINDEDLSERNMAAIGLLYCKGITKNAFDLKDIQDNFELIKELTNDDINIRKNAVEELMRK